MNTINLPQKYQFCNTPDSWDLLVVSVINFTKTSTSKNLYIASSYTDSLSTITQKQYLYHPLSTLFKAVLLYY